jgi:hypothetical protein
MDMGVAAKSKEQRMAREAQAKTVHDQQAKMEAKAKADQEAQGQLPPPPFRKIEFHAVHAIYEGDSKQVYAGVDGANRSWKSS